MTVFRTTKSYLHVFTQEGDIFVLSPYSEEKGGKEVEKGMSFTITHYGHSPL